MDKSIKRTEQEIDEMIKRGEKFVKVWPQSAFGDDNLQPFREFKKIMRMAKEGKSTAQIRERLRRDSEYMDADERMHLEDTVEDDIRWLEGLTSEDEDPYPE